MYSHSDWNRRDDISMHGGNRLGDDLFSPLKLIAITIRKQLELKERSPYFSRIREL